MKKSLSRMAVLVMLMVLVLGVGSALAMVVVDSITVTENSVYHSDGEYYELSFTVDNTYGDIREFAVGNNSAGNVWVDSGASNPSSNLTKGFIADKDETGRWRVLTNDGYRYLTWLNGVSDFATYSKAFLYTSWGYLDSNYSGCLESGFTNGYEGDTLMPMSPFAAYSINGGTITGTTSAVPIPGALWLFGSGLFGLVAVRRRKKI